MKKFLSAVLAFTLVLCVCLPALALSTPIVVLAGVEMRKGDYLHVGATSVSSAAPTDGTGYAHMSADGKTLTLHDFDNQGKNYAYNHAYRTALLINEEISLKLEGANKLTSEGSINDGVTLNDNLTIDESSTGSLEITAGYGIYFYLCDLTINGGTVITNCENASVMGSTFTMNGGKLDIVSNDASALSCSDFNMTGGQLKADGGKYCAIICDHFVMTGGMAELTCTGSGNPVFAYVSLNCTVSKEDHVTITGSEIDTAEALEKINHWENPGKRTVRLGFPKEDPAAPAAVPTTGDNAMIALWAVLGMLSAAGMVWMSKDMAK